MSDSDFGRPASDPIGAAGADFFEDYLPVEPGVSLRVMHWRPRAAGGAPPLLFIPGWISVVSGWADFLRAAVARRPVYYLESREKTSARIAAEPLPVAGFTIDRQARDLLEVCRLLPIEPARTIIAGSSFGATTLLEALKRGALEARAAFLIGPNSEFSLPWITRLVTPLPNVFFHVVKHAIIWYLRTFRVDADVEPEQMRRYEETVRCADPGRLKRSAQAIMPYSVWPALETVVTPVAIAYAPSDTLHGEDNVRRIAAELPRATLIRCESNRAMHRAELVDVLERFAASIEDDDRRP